MKRHGLVFALSALSVALTACSGGSSTLNENPSLNDGSTIQECKRQDCVQFEFTDEPVVNLNYRCGVVVNVTDQTGVGQCPNNSKVEFFLRAKGGKKEILLGETTIRAIRSPLASEAIADAPIVRVTPIDLATTSSDIVEHLDTVQAVQAVQITRLLHAIRDNTRAYVDGIPVNLLKIDHDKIKKHIDQLPADVKFSEFKTAQKVSELEKALAPFLDAAGIDLIDEATAKKRLDVTLRAIQAGAYYGTPTITLPVVNDNDVVDDETVIDRLNADKLKLGVEGQGLINTRMRATMAVYMLRDRDGYSIGQGMYWAGEAQDAKQAYELYRSNSFDLLTLINPMAGFSRFNGRIENFKWKTQPTNNSTNPETEIEFNEGTLLGNVVMAGGEQGYRNVVTTITAKDNVPAFALGKWKQYRLNSAGEAENSPSFEGSATIGKSSSVNTFLDPTVWRTKDTVSSGEKFVFPLHVTFSLRSKEGCSAGVCPVLGDFGATILENGNIISDLDGDCAVVDTQLKETGDNPSQEYRIGVIRAAYTDTQKNNYFIGPSIMLAGTPFQNLKGLDDPTKTYNLDGVQLGTLAVAPRVKMNIAGVINANVGGVGSLNITDSSTEKNVDDGADAARWVNVYSSYYQLITNKTPDQADKAKNYTGSTFARPSSCYTVKKKD